MTWETILPALINDPIQILKGTFFFVLAIVTLPSLFSKVSQTIISIVFLTYHLWHEISQYFLPNSNQLNEVLRQTVPHQPNQHNQLVQEQDDENYSWRFWSLVGRIIDHPRQLYTLLSNDFSCEGDAATIIRSRFKFLFLVLAGVSALLVAYFPSIAAMGLFGLISQTLLIAGISPGLLIVGKAGVTFGVVYALRTFTIALGLLLTTIIQSIGHSVQRCCRRENDSEESLLRPPAPPGGELLNLEEQHLLPSIPDIERRPSVPEATSTLRITQGLEEEPLLSHSFPPAGSNSRQPHSPIDQTSLHNNTGRVVPLFLERTRQERDLKRSQSFPGYENEHRRNNRIG